MLARRIGCLPVVEDNRVVGLITDTDIFESLVMLLGSGQEGARFTLRLPDRPGMLARVAQAVADAGGNIISVTTWQSKDDGKGYITIKEGGANFARLEQALDALEETELVDLHEKPACVQQPFGQA
jgi:acetoin utilization protein AcuB